jgi:hypothetical protein
VLEHVDPVGVADRAQAVGDNDARGVHPLDVGEDDGLIPIVEGEVSVAIDDPPPKPSTRREERSSNPAA